jgi:hypothetical protein
MQIGRRLQEAKGRRTVSSVSYVKFLLLVMLFRSHCSIRRMEDVIYVF